MIPTLGQRKYTMSLECLVVPESKKVLKETCQKNTETNQKPSLIPSLSNYLRLTKFNEKEKYNKIL